MTIDSWVLRSEVVQNSVGELFVHELVDEPPHISRSFGTPWLVWPLVNAEDLLENSGGNRSVHLSSSLEM